jgi:predicted nucleic acid-binding protein
MIASQQVSGAWWWLGAHRAPERAEPDRGLRSRDAIHLATARILGEDLDAIVSYDDYLLKAATDAGLATASPRD